MDLFRWLQLMESWGFERNDDTFNALMRAYSEDGRYYHTQEHVSACLRHLDRSKSDMNLPGEVELALWFHDAIYDARSADNEEKSAEWLVSFLNENGAATNVIDRLYRLVMVTEHNAPTRSHDESLLVDIDLAILGADEGTYAKFEVAVRQEYEFVPLSVFNQKRSEILQGFLQRSKIYNNEPFFNEREAQARSNLEAAIAQLTKC